MKRALAWFWKHWGWAVILAALWAVLGWDGAMRTIGVLILVAFAYDLYERFCKMERQISEIHQMKNGDR